MTLRTFAGLGTLFASISGFGLISLADAGAGEPFASLLCLTLSGLALFLVMGMPGRGEVEVHDLVPAVQYNERGNYL